MSHHNLSDMVLFYGSDNSMVDREALEMKRILCCAVFLAIVLWSVVPVLAGSDREPVAQKQGSRLQQSDQAGQAQPSDQSVQLQQSDHAAELEGSDGAGQVQQSDTGGKVLDGRVIPPYMSVREKVMVQREIQQRAAASRNALMREAQMEREAQQRKSGKTTQ